MAFDYDEFKAEYRRKKRRAAHWWYGRFWAQDVIEELGQGAAEYTTLPWYTYRASAALYDDCPADDMDDPREMELTKDLLTQAAQDYTIQELLRDVFTELAAETAARNLEGLREVRREWSKMVMQKTA